MKIEEIRIGNIIGSKRKPEGWRVYRSDIELILINDEDDYFGISITREWLDKFGVVRLNTIWYAFNQYKMHFDSFGNLAFYDDMAENLTYLRSLQYVHQFQNLYFALKDEELILKQ